MVFPRLTGVYGGGHRVFRRRVISRSSSPSNSDIHTSATKPPAPLPPLLAHLELGRPESGTQGGDGPRSSRARCGHRRGGDRRHGQRCRQGGGRGKAGHGAPRGRQPGGWELLSKTNGSNSASATCFGVCADWSAGRVRRRWAALGGGCGRKVFLWPGEAPAGVGGTGPPTSAASAARGALRGGGGSAGGPAAPIPHVATLPGLPFGCPRSRSARAAPLPQLLRPPPHPLVDNLRGWRPRGYEVGAAVVGRTAAPTVSTGSGDRRRRDRA